MAEHPPTLDLHFLGGSVGESIVIRFPDGKWGVIDAYTRNLKSADGNPTVAFLAEQGVTELAFVCLTHPHEDHYTGLRQVLEDRRWKVHALWRPAILPQPLLSEWLIGILEWRARTGDDLEVKEASELTALFAHVNQRTDLEWDCFRIDRGSDVPCKRLLPIPPGLPDAALPYEVVLFAPPGAQLNRYEYEVVRARTAKNPEQLYNDANGVSVGLRIRYGSTNVVLTGDMTNAAWSEVERHLAEESPDIHVLKVPHHGSRTGYTAARWHRHCSGEHTVAVVFPFHRYRLPRSESRAFIERAAARVLYTVDPVPPPEFAKVDDERDRVALETFGARTVLPHFGRWSLSLNAQAQLVIASAYGHAVEHGAGLNSRA